MRSAILYGSQTKLSKAHHKVSNWGSILGYSQPDYFVRMDTIDGDCVHAMDKARPMDGETVLNTVELIEPCSLCK